MGVEMCITIVLIILGLVGFLGTRYINAQHKNDPYYQQKVKEREAENRRKAAENSMLDDAMTDTTGYNDD